VSIGKIFSYFPNLVYSLFNYILPKNILSKSKIEFKEDVNKEFERDEIFINEKINLNTRLLNYFLILRDNEVKEL
jgi:hypothetical protein